MSVKIVAILIAMFSLPTFGAVHKICDKYAGKAEEIRIAYDNGESFEERYIKYQTNDEMTKNLRYLTIIVYQGQTDHMGAGSWRWVNYDLCVANSGSK